LASPRSRTACPARFTRIEPRNACARSCRGQEVGARAAVPWPASSLARRAATTTFAHVAQARADLHRHQQAVALALRARSPAPSSGRAGRRLDERLVPLEAAGGDHHALARSACAGSCPASCSCLDAHHPADPRCMRWRARDSRWSTGMPRSRTPLSSDPISAWPWPRQSPRLAVGQRRPRLSTGRVLVLDHATCVSLATPVFGGFTPLAPMSPARRTGRPRCRATGRRGSFAPIGPRLVVGEAGEQCAAAHGRLLGEDHRTICGPASTGRR
jgi:hypothetical protein